MGLEEANPEDLEGQDAKGKSCHGNVDKGNKRFQLLALKACVDCERLKYTTVIIFSLVCAHALTQKIKEDDGTNEANDHGAHDDALPDEVPLADAWAIGLDSEGNQWGDIDAATKNVLPLKGSDGTDEFDRGKDGVGDDTTFDGAATAASGRLIVAIDTHCGFLDDEIILFIKNGHFERAEQKSL